MASCKFSSFVFYSALQYFSSMFIVIFGIIVAISVIVYTVFTKHTAETYDTDNVELLKYFELISTPDKHSAATFTNMRRQQLLKAAKYLIEISEYVRRKESSAEDLYKNHNLLSEEYMKKITKLLEEQIFVEKCLIQREAEEIKNNYGEIVFSEANALPNTLKREKTYEPFIDKKLFTLKHNNLLKAAK